MHRISNHHQSFMKQNFMRHILLKIWKTSRSITIEQWVRSLLGASYIRPGATFKLQLENDLTRLDQSQPFFQLKNSTLDYSFAWLFSKRWLFIKSWYMDFWLFRFVSHVFSEIGLPGLIFDIWKHIIFGCKRPYCYISQTFKMYIFRTWKYKFFFFFTRFLLIVMIAKYTHINLTAIFSKAISILRYLSSHLIHIVLGWSCELKLSINRTVSLQKFQWFGCRCYEEIHSQCVSVHGLLQYVGHLSKGRFYNNH